VPDFEQPKRFTNDSPQRLVHDKMQYLETIADAAFEILKDKFQYVFDQLELENKQHQAMKGRFVSYLQEHVVTCFNSSCYDIRLVKAHLLEYFFLFGFAKTGLTVRGVWYAEEQNELANCHLSICFSVIVGFARPSNDVQVKWTCMFAYQIKSGYTFPPPNQLQVGAMVWLVWIKISRM